MTSEIGGIHHVTAICRDPRNLDLYAGLLGLGLAIAAGAGPVARNAAALDAAVQDTLAQAVAASDAVAQHAIRLDFETWPDGSSTCERCPVSDQYRSRGVVFEFFSPFTGRVAPYLVASGAYEAEGRETNHAVTATLGDEGFRPGLLTLRFADGTRRVAFSLRGPDPVHGFVVRAFGPDGSPVSDGALRRVACGTYRAGRGGVFREERIVVESEGGIGRVELDGRGPPGHILLVDDLTLWPGHEAARRPIPGPREEGEAGRPPRGAGSEGTARRR